MGTDLYEVQVTDIQDRVIKWTIRAIHPDRLEIPSSKTFVFMVLLDPIWDWEEEVCEYTHGMPLYNDIDESDLHGGAYTGANAGGIIESVKIDATRTYPMSEDEYANIVETEEKDRLREADHTITVTHRGWALHIAKGMKWSSRAYDVGDEEPWGDRKRYPGDTLWVPANDQDEGFFVAEKNDYIKHISTELRLPKFGAKHYEPDPALLKQDMTVDALQDLLFQPVALYSRNSLHLFGAHVGSLIDINENAVTLYYQTEYEYGTQGFQFDSLVYIGRARYRKSILLA